ncbi:Aste57867_24707 [Aphanomyces stellatus]|uniref:Microsomal glutathione S-transferase 1 n=1 Tax=Aphanomyces stellatus TaxID=120398 RepID=A0A485LS58_9STRA|nr:hypothetical protein As57867_024629 [Aphanomyces stellatus]VFU01344.1 Aste57867_24707 [Aphanomyces stellatus]
MTISASYDTKALIAATGILAIKLYMTLMIQGGKRFHAGTRPPEDKMFKGLNPKKQRQTFGVFVEGADAKKDDDAASSGDKKDAKAIQEKPSARAIQADIRWERIVRNDLENIPIGLFAAWAAVHSGGSALVNSGAIALFTVARILHTISYAKELQPHRGIFWGIGVLCVLTLVANSFYGLAMTALF